MTISTVTRAHLADLIYIKMGIPHKEASKIIDHIFNEIISGLISNDCVKIPLFGSFYVKQKKERIGRNPKTKEEVMIEARKIVSFYASRLLKEDVNIENE